MVLQRLVVLFILLIAQNEAAKILAMFPVPSISHQVVFRPLTLELAKRGHQVTVITPDPAFKNSDAPANYTEIDVHDISYKIWADLYSLTSTGKSDVVSQMELAYNIIIEIVEAQLKVDAVQKLIKEEKFDLFLNEACSRTTMILSHVFQAPTILVSSLGPSNHYITTIGTAWHPLLYPVNMNVRLHNLSNWEKIKELWNFYKFHKISIEIEKNENAMIQKLFGPDVPTVHELKNRADMLFLNIHPLWENNRPVPPSVVYMGGIHQKPKKSLPKDLQNYLDSSKNGVIYMSFGTNVKTSMLPPEKLQTIVKALSQLPYNVLMVYDGDVLPGQSKNIRISKFFPQADLLRHPKTKLFITQGGLQSTDEAITAGVPMIGIPFFIDQWYNTEQYVYYKIGIKLDVNTITEEELRNTIDTIIGDNSYRQNVVKLRELMNDQPQRPLERAVWWAEHVLRHGGGKHLRSPTANISWTEYLELELVFTVLAVFLLSLSVILTVLYKLYKCIVSKKTVRVKTS